MPELPEVETIRRQLEPRLRGRRVLEAGSHPSPKFVAAREIVGRTFTKLGRRGKFLLIGLDQDYELVAHLGMTGKFRFVPDNLEGPSIVADRELDPNRHRRAWWSLDDGERFEFIDVRRFGRLKFVRAGDYRTLPALHAAGPEPFDPKLDGQTFHRLLQKSRRPIKTYLLSQRPIAGVGNIYADEALWLAKINPRASRVGLQRATLLLAAIREVLGRGIENGGTTLRDYRTVDGGVGQHQHDLEAYGRAGQPCSRCDTTLRSQVLDARTTTWCGHCQRR